MNCIELARWALIQQAIQDITELDDRQVEVRFDHLATDMDTFVELSGTVADYLPGIAKKHLDHYPRLKEVMGWEANSGVGVHAVLRIKCEMAKTSPNWPYCFNDIQTYAFS